MLARMVRPGGTPVFDPATLSLSGWWRASYAGSPWTPTASAGSSGSNGNLSEATNPPATGTAINGLTPGDWDGTNDILQAAGTSDTFFNAQAFSGWILFNADSVATDDATLYLDDCLISTQPNGYFLIGLRSSGSLGIRFVTGGEAIVTASFSIGSWQLVQWKYDGANIKLRVNSGAWQSTAQTGDFGDLTQTLNFGPNYDGSTHFNGRMADIGLSDTVLSDANFDNVKSYANSRYALSL